MKRGISLIVLVITIIVMIILAASVVITLSNTGVINRASQAVDLTNEASVQDLAALIWADAFIDGKRGENLVTAVTEKLGEQGISTKNWNIDITDSGVTITYKDISKIPLDWQNSVREITEDGVPIPIGFVKSPYSNEGTKDGGLVIYALTEDEIRQGKTTIKDEHQTALETRNQFVWVPVDSENFETLFRRTSFSTTSSNISYVLGETNKYWELIVDENNMVSQNTETENISTRITKETLQEATEMYKSVKKYGGFYIARYEAGMPTTEEYGSFGHIASRATLSDGTNKKITVTMGKYPYNGILWFSSIGDSTVLFSRAFYPRTETTYGVVSTLTYGVQWDRILCWWLEQNPQLDIKASASFGVYKNAEITSEDLNINAMASAYIDGSNEIWQPITGKLKGESYLFTTGAYKKACVYNIYDIAGNLGEWTMERYSDNKCAYRGSSFSNNGTAISRSYLSSSNGASWVGFRPALYIK